MVWRAGISRTSNLPTTNIIIFNSGFFVEMRSPQAMQPKKCERCCFEKTANRHQPLSIFNGSMIYNGRLISLTRLI
jgi:hypothetical protein